MAQPPSFHQLPGQSQNLKQMQRLIMSPEMQQAIHLLQVPVMELASIIEMEIEQNPLLEGAAQDEEQDAELERLEESIAENDLDGEDSNPDQEMDFDENNFEVLKQLDEEYRDYFSQTESVVTQKTREEEKLQTFQQSNVQATESLFEHLMREARETLSDAEELRAAELLIGNFDENGFIQTPLSEIALLNRISEHLLAHVLNIIRTFDPAGVGATGLADSLLLQLTRQGLKDSLAYRIVHDHFDDLVHNRIRLIQQKLHCTSGQIAEAVEQSIAKLDLHPGLWFSKDIVQQLVPDVMIHETDGELKASVNNDHLPSIRLNSRYLRMLNDETLSPEAKDFIRQKLVSAKWLIRNLFQRSSTIERIAQMIAEQQKDYLTSPSGKLKPLTMKMVADELGLHESTIARTVANKYADTDRGIVPLRAFFTNGLETDHGDEVSSDTVRQLLQEIIGSEEKSKPFSDQKISGLMAEKGIHCARRTVAKYRGELGIGNAQQRRKF